LDGPVDTIERYAAWCGELIDALGLESLFVVGCSIGGKIALQLALDQPTRVAGVVAMAADGWNDALSVKGLKRSLEDAGSPSRGDRTYLGTLAACGSSIDPVRVEAIARRHQCEDPEVSVLDLVAWSLHDLRDRAQLIACPVHLLYGTDDFWVRGSDIETFGAAIPEGRVDALVGVGHYPMEEMPDFARRLHGWLEQFTNADAT
jgi:pimeloyl-ACP methyl ester carboxylesterase